MRTNSLSFRVYVTQEEKNHIQTSASDCRMSLSAFCRTLALEAMPTSKQGLVQVDKLVKAVTDLNRLGNLMKMALTNTDRFDEMGATWSRPPSTAFSSTSGSPSENCGT